MSDDKKTRIIMRPVKLCWRDGEDELKKAVTERWFDAANIAKRVSNIWHQTWHTMHFAANATEQLQQFLDVTYKKWKDTPAADKIETPAIPDDVKQLVRDYAKSLEKREKTEDERASQKDWSANAMMRILPEILPADHPFRAAVDAYHATPEHLRKAAPQCKVQAMPEGFDNEVYRRLRLMFPTFATRPLVLQMAKMRGTLSSKTRPNSAMKWWTACLLGIDRTPQCTEPQPIQVDKANMKIIKSGAFDWKVEIKTRSYVKSNGTSGLIVDTAWIDFNNRGEEGSNRHKKRVAQTQEMMNKINDGTYKLLGSQLEFHKGWELRLAMRVPIDDVPTLDATKTVTLSPGTKCPWVLTGDGIDGEWWVAGRGTGLMWQRESLTRMLRDRKQAYRTEGTSAEKGHGRDRATRSWSHLNARWGVIVRGANQRLVARVMQTCRELGAGTLVYRQPDDTVKPTLFLNDAETRCSWDYYQVLTFLQNAGQRFGVEVVGEKWTEVRDETNTKAKPKKGEARKAACK